MNERSNVKKRSRPKKPHWVHAAVGAAPDPRINPKNPEYHKRRVDRVVLVDSVGRAFEFRDFAEPKILPPPPPIDDPPEEA